MVPKVEALPALFHNEGRDAPGADVGGGDGKHHVCIRLGGVGDEDLAAVEDVVVPLEDGGGLGAAGVRAGVDLGQAEGANLFTPGQGHQIFLFLLLGAVGIDGPGAQGHMGRQDDAGAAVHPGQLLYCDGVAQGVQPRAAVFPGEGDAHQAKLAQLADGIVGEFILLVQHESDGFDFLLSKSADFGPQFFMGLGGLKQHGVTSFET